MPTYINVEVKGLQETFRKLAALGSNIQKKASVDMTRAAASTLARAVRKNCPVRTGTLKKSIRSIRILKSASSTIIYRVGFTSGRNAKYNGWYAQLAEFGALPHTIPKRGEQVPMRVGDTIFMGPIQHPGAQPTRFVTRSFEETYPSSIAKASRAFEKALTKYGTR